MSILKHIPIYGALAPCVGVLLIAAACQSPIDGRDDDDSSSGLSAANGPTTGGSGGTTSQGGGSSVGGSGGNGGDCSGPESTIEQITTGQTPVGERISLDGVVAMSQKFLVSKSSNDNCLWGVFVSSPGLTVTGPNTGILIMSYGFQAEVPMGGTQSFCPRLGQDPAGDRIPDNVQPGDVLDVVGRVARFPESPNCSSPNPPNQVGMLQLGQVCKADIVGNATPPTAALISGGDIEKIASTTDQAFHDAWGGVKMRIENVQVDPQDGQVVGGFGVIKLTNGLEFGNKIYYRGYSTNFCHSAPEYSDPNMTFDYVEGFHYLNFCTWRLDPNDKCADLSPQSEDCMAGTCPPDMLR